MHIFERVSKEKTRFSSSKGELMTEQLWDLPLTSDGLSLDQLARGVNRELVATEEESFVNTTPNPQQDKLRLKLAVLKHIIGVKMAAIERAKQRAAASEEKSKLLSVLAQQQEDALKNLKPEQIKARLRNLDKNLVDGE